MSDQQLALTALLGAGAAAVGGGLALSGRGLELPTVWYRLCWPREVDPEGVVALLRQLAADRRRHVLALEVVARDGHLTYLIGIAERHCETVLGALSSHLPGLIAELVEHDIVRAPNYAWQLSLSSTHRALRHNAPTETSRSLVSSLASASAHHDVIFQWLLGPRLQPIGAPHAGSSPPAASWGDLLRQTITGKTPHGAAVERSIKDKIEEAGFRSVCRIGVCAPNARTAQALAATVLAALRTSEAPGVRIKLKADDPTRLAEARPPRSWPVALNVKELVALCGWPLGTQAYPGVSRSAARLLPPSDAIAKEGRIIGSSSYPGNQRTLALSPVDSLQNAHFLGPTGVGKSTLLLNLIVQDIAAGRGVLVVDAKGDLVEEVLQRVPDSRRSEIVVLDPADEQRPVGLNVLAGGGRPAELIADQVLAVFHDLYRDSWGPRTQDILHAALLTLAGEPNMTLCALPVLLSNARFRRKAVAKLTDEVALKPFWSWFDQLSEGERQQAIAPVMNKLRAFLLRPRMRAVIGQAQPGFTIDSVLYEHKVLLVSLAKGLIGPEAAALLGSLVVSQFWQAALGRVRLPAERRAPVMAFIDEFQDSIHGVTDLAEVLAQARGLGVGLTLAHQHLAQLPANLRSAVLANARSRCCFQLGSEDARLIAATTDDLSASDFQALGRYEIYASLVAGGRVTPYCSARTLAPSAPISEPETIRALSRQRYGCDLREIEAQLGALIDASPTDDEQPIGRKRRT